MTKTHRFSLLLLSFFCLLSISRSAPSSSSFSPLPRESLGIPPEDLKYFKSDIIKCKDGSKKFTKAQLNDDFCDCPDGTDEPGTSACARGKFYCRNTGHGPLSIFSSRVNDGICDCCDGSDEYDGIVKCPNTCWEAGKVSRDRLKKKIAIYKEGVTIRKKEIEQAKQSISKDQAELSKLKSNEKILKCLVQQLKDRKEQIEKAEERERLEKEKEEKKKKESEEKANEEEKDSTESQHDESHEAIETLDDRQDASKVNANDALEVRDGDNSGNEASHNHGAEQLAANNKKTMVDTERSHDVDESNTSPEVGKQEKDGLENTEGLSKEELGRLVASRWTGERSGDETKAVNNGKKEEQTGNSETQEIEPDEFYDGYNSLEDNEKYNDDVAEEEDIDDDFDEDDHRDSDASYKSDSEDQTDFSDITTTSSPSWLDKIQQTVRNILQAVNLFQSAVDKSEAAQVRKEYEDASTKLSKIESRVSSLSQKLEHDFGPEKEFYSFYDRCFENKENKYVYKVCPFKEASQVEGHSTTQLGHWEKFEDSYRTMLFLNGDRCWNGPDRSLKLKLRCGLDNELTDVDEPSRCEYVAILSTPALCLEEKLKELQHKLDLMNKEQLQSRDEL